MTAVCVLIFGLAIIPRAGQAPTSAGVAQAAAPATAASPVRRVKRIYVESFGTDADSRETQALIVTALVNSKSFVVTENRSRADAILRGEVIANRSQELHAYSEGTAVGGAAGSASANGDNATAAIVARHLGASDSTVDTETVESATVTVRLVDPDGDVIWSTSEQSHGGKYEGAEASAADACVKQLLRDLH